MFLSVNKTIFIFLIFANFHNRQKTFCLLIKRDLILYKYCYGINTDDIFWKCVIIFVKFLNINESIIIQLWFYYKKFSARCSLQETNFHIDSFTITKKNHFQIFTRKWKLCEICRNLRIMKTGRFSHSSKMCKNTSAFQNRPNCLESVK